MEKQRWEESEKAKESEEREKVGKPRNTVFFQWFVARRQGLCTLSKVSKTWGFVAFPKGMAGVGHMQRIWQDIFRVAGAVQETCSSELFGGPGADFLRWVAFWSIRSSGLLRWFFFGSFAIVWRHPGMPDVLPSCVVVFVPCRVCLFWRHRTVCLKMSVPDVCLPFSYLSVLTVRSHGHCSFSPQTHGKKGWVVWAQGIVLERCLTFLSLVSYTTTETKGLFALCLVCASVACLLAVELSRF